MTIFKLREYQQIALDHLANHPRCALWADMGLGKTVTTLTHLNRLYIQGFSKPTLVLAPTLVANSTWPDEIKKWSHLSELVCSTVTGNVNQRRKALARDANVFTMNYDNLQWLVDFYGDKWPFTKVVADESTRLKSFRLGGAQGKRARALGKVAHTHIKHFIELTGTPSPNGMQDLWGQLWMLDGGKRLGRTYTAFKDRWFTTGYNGFGLNASSAAIKEIQDKISDICLTLRASDWFDLDEPLVTSKYIELPDKVRVEYDKMEKDYICQIENHEIEASQAAVKSQKLIQLASGAIYLNKDVDSDADKGSTAWKEVHDQKIQMLESIINEANGNPVLVAYHFRSDLERLKKAFKHAVALTRKNVTEVVQDWNDGKIPILLAHPASAGHGLSLHHGGHTLVYFTHDWNLENRLQILERIGPVRQKQAGYDRNVLVYNIIARDTIDEDVISRIGTKKSIQDALMGRKNGTVD